MLSLAMSTRDGHEIAEQLVRPSVAALASALGKYPVGNTGRATVPATLPMPFAGDLAALLSIVSDT